MEHETWNMKHGTSSFMPHASSFKLQASSFMPLVSCRSRYIYIIIMFAAMFMPAMANGFEIDPYSLNRLSMNVDFSYENYKYDSKDNKREYSTFRQRYNFEAKGKIIDRRLLIYDAGIEFDETTDEKTPGGTSGINISKYMLRTTLLPKSSIPLTLYANRNVYDTTYSNKATTDTYGLDWMLWFITFPTTHLTLEQQSTQSPGQDEAALSYSIDLSKNIEPTSNKIGYSAGDTRDSIRKSGSEYYMVTFNNNTELIMNTYFHLGLAEGETRSFSKNNTADYYSYAGSVGVKTRDTKIFSQQYNYTFFESNQKTANERLLTDNEFFSGNVTFNPADGLSAFAKMQSNKYNSTKSPTSESTVISAGASYKHDINTEWSTIESVDYSSSASTSGDPVTGKRERTAAAAKSELKYLKLLTWADSFSAGGSLGYFTERAEPAQGIDGLSHGLNTALSGINLKYARLSSGYTYSGVASSDGSSVKDQTFYTTAHNSYFTYLPAMVSYNYHELDSYINSEDAKEEAVTAEAKLLYFNYLPVEASYKHYTIVRSSGPPPEQKFAYIRDKQENNFSAKASLTYFRNTAITAYATYNDYIQSVEEQTAKRNEINNEWKTGIDGSHKRIFLAGMLGLSAGYASSLSENRGMGNDIIRGTINIYYKGSYDKKLGRNMVWKLKLERNNTAINGLADVVDSMETSLLYRLRAWFISAEYLLTKAAINSTANRDYTEDKWMLRVSRSFVKIF
ncbi:MAG: hypothetical protein HZB80_09825 [Deltaproteobacteria bacterium]|nr:hypothetical protein [Deltaproteobacteria bacterium]